MPEYGIEVTEGRDTHAATPEQLLYTSAYQSPKLHRLFRGTFTTDASSVATVTVTHDLPYPPVVFAYYGDGTNWYIPDNSMIGMEANRFTAVLRTKASPSADPSYAKLAPSTTYQYKFWIFTDPTQEWE